VKAQRSQINQAFLSAEDLDLENLSWTELLEVWNSWLQQAQATNEEDRHSYEHGVFLREPTGPPQPADR
jgi:hypothetical protein